MRGQKPQTRAAVEAPPEVAGTDVVAAAVVDEPRDKDIEAVERLLRAIYHPQNVY